VICLLQRVTQASVTVQNVMISEIEHGLIVLVGFQSKDVTGDLTAEQAILDRMADRLLGYRVFPDDQDRMNLNVLQAGGGVLLVPQFTLAADTRSGLRPGFQTAAAPADAESLFDRFLEAVKSRHAAVQQGRFGADMQVSLVNNGPVTFWQRENAHDPASGQR